jgi:hypothetical protein
MSMTGVLPATTPTIGTLAYLILETPGAVYTTSGLLQLAAFAATLSTLSYTIHGVSRCAEAETGGA